MDDDTEAEKLLNAIRDKISESRSKLRHVDDDEFADVFDNVSDAFIAAVRNKNLCLECSLAAIVQFGAANLVAGASRGRRARTIEGIKSSVEHAIDVGIMLSKKESDDTVH